nr:MAG TPA: intron associated endonuclease [Caudoviricetes sp.]DAH93860.1 MAG TPA: intron associated endonuclease [Caudoviricetes sp.]
MQGNQQPRNDKMNDFEREPKKGYGFIYMYTSPSGKKYIGQTTRSLFERGGRRGQHYKGCDCFYSAIQKYGFNSFEWEILKEVKIFELNEAEKEFIQKYNTLTPNGYNISAGGQYIGKGRKVRAVYQYSAVDGSLIREWKGGSPEIAKETNIKGNYALENCLIGKTYMCHGYCWSYIKMEHFPIENRKVDNNRKEIKQYSLDGKKLLRVFSSVSEAARESGCERSAIKRCCRGELHYHGGYVWRFSDESNLERRYYNSTPQKIAQVDKETGKVIQIFDSLNKACAGCGVPYSTYIKSVLDSATRTAYGYYWKSV